MRGVSPFHTMQTLRAAIAEFLGTFLLSFAVLAGVNGDLFPIPTPFAAAAVLGIFVYLAGGISGAHINPAVTIALATMRKIENKRAVAYVVAQCLGGLVAMAIFRGVGTLEPDAIDGSAQTMFFEAIGTFMLLFGISAVVHGAVQQSLSGLVIGGSLLIGIMISLSGGAGALNPAVSLTLNTLNPATLLGPIIGGIAGAWSWVFLSKR